MRVLIIAACLLSVCCSTERKPAVGVPAPPASKGAPNAPASKPQQKRVHVHYLGNAGVMVKWGQTKILFDPFFRNVFGLYERVPEPIEGALFAGTPPYDGVDAVFISHHHGDHFSPEVVASYLRAQQRAVLVGPEQAVVALIGAGGPPRGARVRGVRLDVGQAPARLSFGSIEVEAVRVPHSGWPNRHRNVENLAYRVTLDGSASVVHLGDADPQQEHFHRNRAHWARGRRPTASFPPYWFFGSEAGRAIILTYLRADRAIGVHVPANVPDDPNKREPAMRGYDLFTRPGEHRALAP